MPATPVNELIQSAQQVQAVALKIIDAVNALDSIYRLREDGLVNFDDLTSQHLEALGLVEASQLNKLVDQNATLQDIRSSAIRAKGIRG